MTYLNPAIQDLRRAFRQYQTWLHLGTLEVRQRYRRSILGPWWITISMLIFICAMGLLFSRLFAQDLNLYVPFFTTGFLLWSFISSCINESTEILKSNSGFIKQIDLPYNLYIFKYLTRNSIIFAHNFVVYLLVIGFFHFNPGWNCLFAIPGLLLLLLNMYWICLVTTLISTRFRDMVAIVNSSVQILFFITPISWMPKLIGENSIIVKFNPFVYLIDAVREPLLGRAPSLIVWMIDSGIALFGLTVGFLLFGRARQKIPFWVD